MSLTNSITPEELESILGKAGVRCPFSQEERRFFSTTPVVAAGQPLFAYPIPADNSALTLTHLRNIFGIDPRRQPSFFDHPWYANQDFMNVPATSGWHCLWTDVLPGSINQPADYIRSVAGRGLELPIAVEVVLMLFLYYIRTGEQLLSRKHTWCRDLVGAEQVTVGAFGRNGLFLSKHPFNYASRGLGICPKLALTTS